jgi:hypothetical protein
MDQGPPIFKSWLTWYALVIGILVVQIFLYFWLTVSFQ